MTRQLSIDDSRRSEPPARATVSSVSQHRSVEVELRLELELILTDGVGSTVSLGGHVGVEGFDVDRVSERPIRETATDERLSRVTVYL